MYSHTSKNNLGEVMEMSYPTSNNSNSNSNSNININSDKESPRHDRKKRTFEVSRDECLAVGDLTSELKSENDSSFESPIIRRPQHENSDRSKLTLSAFRRKSQSMVDTDSSRKLTDVYTIDFVVGRGVMSTVRRATRKSDRRAFAIKSIAKHDILRSRRLKRSSSSHRRYVDEWEILRLLKHNTNVVDLVDVFENEDEVQLVLEYCESGELFKEIQQLRKDDSPPQEDRARLIATQMLVVLRDMHNRGIVHRDIKPENILLATKDLFKLCDFGLARLLSDDDQSIDTCSTDGETSPITPVSRNRAFSAVGSNLYAAPEMSTRKGYDTAVDVYALGCTLYVYLSGYTPSIRRGNPDSRTVSFPPKPWNTVSSQAKDLILKMLNPDPELRIDVEGALNHNWLKKPLTQDAPPVGETISAQNITSPQFHLHKSEATSLGQLYRETPKKKRLRGASLVAAVTTDIMLDTASTQYLDLSTKVHQEMEG